MDIRTSLNQGINAQRLVDQYGRQAVVDEIFEMTGDDMADVALAAAIELDDKRLIALASRIILCGSYGQRATRLAAQNNRDLDLEDTRRKFIRKEK